jgi:nuclear transcription factor Y gamma
MLPVKPARIGTKLPEHQEQQLAQVWKRASDEVTHIKPGTDYKVHADLPLSRVKRVMKADADVRMVAAETPVLFAKACQLFINDLTFRAWLETTEEKRKTLQKQDVHTAISKADMYDFLTDVANGVVQGEIVQQQQQQQHVRPATSVLDNDDL